MKKLSDTIITVEQRTNELLNQSISCHPSREDDLQVREAIRFLAKQIDILHTLRINGSQLKKGE